MAVFTSRPLSSGFGLTPSKRREADLVLPTDTVHLWRCWPWARPGLSNWDHNIRATILCIAWASRFFKRLLWLSRLIAVISQLAYGNPGEAICSIREGEHKSCMCSVVVLGMWVVVLIHETK